MKHVAMGLSLCVVLPLIALAAYAGDAQKGKHLAQIRCAVCDTSDRIFECFDPQ